MARAQPKTLQKALTQVRDGQARIAVNLAIVSWLRLRYISRDAADASAKFKMPDGSPVPEEAIILVAADLEDENSELASMVNDLLGSEVAGG